MLPTDPDQATKLAELRALQSAGTSPRVAELVLVEWRPPDGPIYYATRMAADLLASATVLDQLDGPLELRLGAGIFLEAAHEAGIGDDTIPLDWWDGDSEITRLLITHGAGVRAELFYYFPDVDLFVSEWWGHVQPPTAINIDRVVTRAEAGFRSSNLPLPGRAFFTGCQAVFGGLLSTQAEIDEGDCPYSRHLASATPSNRFGSDATWKQTRTPADGWQALGFDDSSWAAAVSEGVLNTFPWNHNGGVELPTFPPGTAAEWIWWQPYTPGDLATVYFRKTFTPLSDQALITAAGDGRIKGYLNGALILEGADWTRALAVNAKLLTGPNVLAFEVENSFTAGVNPGGLVCDVAEGITGVGFGLLDPATGLPFTDCPRNTPAVCAARLGDSLSYLAFDTVAESHIVNETKGPNITVTSRGNETNLKRPLRVIAGQRHVFDLDLLAFVVEPDTKHPDEGSVKCLYAVGEGPNNSIANGKINGNLIAPQHYNYRNGEKRQAQTSFSPNILNYSGTGLFLGVAQGDFTKTGAEDLRGEADVEGLRNVRAYSDPMTYQEQFTSERGWWLLHCLRNKRWGYGLDDLRVMIEDFLTLADWCREVVAQKDKDGNDTTGPRTQFNAELIERTAQQQITDICLSGRFGLPFTDRGKLRVVPLRRADELFSAFVFTDQAFWSVLNRPPTGTEGATWVDALEAARDISNDALWAEGQARQLELFNSSEYAARARTDPEFVTDCYHSYLRRPPDEAGLAFWLDVLATTPGGRNDLLAAFNASGEFKDLCADHPVATFSDRGDERNVCFANGKTTLSFSMQSDAELCNRIVLTFDDQTQQNTQIPLTFEDVDQQLRAGRAFGDTSRRAVERPYTAFGVTSIGEAGRLGNLLLNLGEFDEGGVANNLRVEFVTWYLSAVELHKYQIIKIESDKLDRINDARTAQGLEAFDYFRIRELKRNSDLTVEISAQAYPVLYYDRLELLNRGPVLPPTIPGGDGGFDPDDPNGPARRRLPFDVTLLDVDTTADQLLFTIGEEAI